MANDDIYTALRTLQNTYDQYFTSLAKGEPVDIELPEVSIEKVKDMVQELVPVDLKIGGEELNDVMDAMKAGFAFMKLNKEDSRWATGFKLTSVKENVTTDDGEEDHTGDDE